MAFVEFKNVKKIYKMGEIEVKAANNLNLEIEEGEFVVIVGPSGSGKTTALNMLGGMDTVTSGHIFLDGKEITKLDKKQLVDYRRYDVGFVFQFYNLIQNLTALENVELANQLCEHSLDSYETLCKVGLKNRVNNFPAQLSGGEQQRVSIARAMAKNPKLLLCDEPTGALDYKTGKRILQILQNTATKYHKTVIVITHNTAFCEIANRVIKLREGKTVDQYSNPSPAAASSLE